jgi:hypothetical protein
MGKALDAYVPPTADEPLDEIQRAIVRALVPVIAARVREELATEQQSKAGCARPDTAKATADRHA